MLVFEEIDAKDFRTALRVLKEVDAKVTANLRSKLKNELQPYATRLAAQMPQIAPLSGMNHNGPTAYVAPQGKVSFTPGSSSKTATRLLAIQLDSGSKRGFYIAELAGTRTSGSTPSGRALVNNLNQFAPLSGKRKKGGRFAWAKFVRMYADVSRISGEIINDTLTDLEKEL